MTSNAQEALQNAFENQQEVAEVLANIGSENAAQFQSAYIQGLNRLVDLMESGTQMLAERIGETVQRLQSITMDDILDLTFNDVRQMVMQNFQQAMQ